MNVHKNARLTRWGRERLARAVVSGQTPEAAARAAGVCPRTARKWVTRFRTEGIEGLKDRSSRPHRFYRPTPTYPSSDHRARELPIWLHRYNWHRPHGSLKSKPPISRLALNRDDVLRLHS
jgi:transposase InsO family protein